MTREGVGKSADVVGASERTRGDIARSGVAKERDGRESLSKDRGPEVTERGRGAGMDLGL